MRRSTSTFDQKALAILAYEPGGRTAAAAPGLAGFRVAILGDRRRFAGCGALARETQFFSSQVVLGHLLFDLGDRLGNFLLACRRDFLVEFFELGSQLLVRGHDGYSDHFDEN